MSFETVQGHHELNERLPDAQLWQRLHSGLNTTFLKHAFRVFLDETGRLCGNTADQMEQPTSFLFTIFPVFVLPEPTWWD